MVIASLAILALSDSKAAARERRGPPQPAESTIQRGLMLLAVRIRSYFYRLDHHFKN